MQVTCFTRNQSSLTEQAMNHQFHVLKIIIIMVQLQVFATKRQILEARFQRLIKSFLFYFLRSNLWSEQVCENMSINFKLWEHNFKKKKKKCYHKWSCKSNAKVTQICLLSLLKRMQSSMSLTPRSHRIKKGLEQPAWVGSCTLQVQKRKCEELFRKGSGDTTEYLSWNRPCK